MLAMLLLSANNATNIHLDLSVQHVSEVPVNATWKNSAAGNMKLTGQATAAKS
jgi:hypothetical protein